MWVWSRALEGFEVTSFYKMGRRGEAFLQTIPRSPRVKQGMAVAKSMGTGTFVLIGTLLSPMTCIVFLQNFAGILMFTMVGLALDSSLIPKSKFPNVSTSRATSFLLSSAQGRTRCSVECSIKSQS